MATHISTLISTHDSTRPSAPTDEQLFRRYRSAGDPAALETLVHRYERELFGFLCRYLHDRELAADVFQATFLQVHRKADRFEEGRPFRPWLYAVATHQAIDERRRTRRHRMTSLDALGAADDGHHGGPEARPERAAAARAEDAEDRDRLRTAVDLLPEPQRAALALVYFRGVKYREAAQLLHVPVGTVKSRLHAAVARLGAILRRPAAGPLSPPDRPAAAPACS